MWTSLESNGLGEGRQGTEVTGGFEPRAASFEQPAGGSHPEIAARSSQLVARWLFDLDAARASLNAYGYTAAADLAVDVFLADFALRGYGMVQVDGPGIGMGIEIERCVLWQAQFYAAGAGVNHPSARGLAFYLDTAAAGLGLKRTAHAAQFQSSGAIGRPHRSWSGLLQRNVAAAGFAVETAGDPGSVNRPAARAHDDAAAGAIDVNISRTRVRANPGTDVGNLHAAGATVGVKRSGDAGDFLAAGAAGRTQLCVRGHYHVVADGNVVTKLRVVNVADADVVPALLNGRVVFQLLHPAFGGSHPVAVADVSGDVDFAGTAGAHMDGAGAGFDLQVHRPGDVQGAVKAAFRSECGQGPDCQDGNTDYERNFESKIPETHTFLLCSRTNASSKQRARKHCPVP